MSSTQIEVPEVNGQDASLADNPLIHNPEKHLSSEARAFLTRPKKLYIDGQFIDAADGEMFETEDPALGIGITRIPAAGGQDIVRAASAAREAFEKRWRYIAPAQRATYLFKLADLISQNSEELAQLEAYDTGKPLTMTRGEMGFAAEIYRYYGGWATKLAERASTFRCKPIRTIA
jgi:phenylacetaldehyde dehydrogenase